jgi:putative transcriptional regulator
MASTARKLLVSIPTLHDPNFFRSVVFMIEHTDEGALGLVLNQPTETRVDDVLDAWAPYAAAPAVAFVGGPVQQHEAVIGLARVGTVHLGDGHVGDADLGDADAWQPLIGRVGTVDLGRDPHDARADLEAVRIFAGYSGWGPSQLEGEIDAGGWFVVDAHADDLLTSDPAGLWRTVLRRQGGDLAVSANYPLGGEGPAAN